MQGTRVHRPMRTSGFRRRCVRSLLGLGFREFRVSKAQRPGFVSPLRPLDCWWQTAQDSAGSMYLCTDVCTQVSMYVRMYVCMYVCMHICTYICSSTYMSINIYVCLCISLYRYRYMYRYIYIHTYLHVIRIYACCMYRFRAEGLRTCTRAYTFDLRR